MIETPSLQDPANPNRFVTYNQSALTWLQHGPSNQAMCVIDKDAAVYSIPTVDTIIDGKFSLMVWLRHYCNVNDTLILHSRFFTISCYFSDKQISSQRVIVAFTDGIQCQYHFPASNGIWYHLMVKRSGVKVDFFVNGVEVKDIVEDCDGSPAPTSDYFLLGSDVCVDELYGAPTVPEYKNYLANVNGQSKIYGYEQDNLVNMGKIVFDKNDLIASPFTYKTLFKHINYLR